MTVAVYVCAALVFAVVQARADDKSLRFRKSMADSTNRSSNGDFDISVSLRLASLSAEEAGGVCYGGNSAGLGRTTLRLEYRVLNELRWTGIERMDNISLDAGQLQFNIPVSPEAEQECVQFRLVQEEHGGGFCNCWSVQDPEITNTSKLRTRGGGSIWMCLTSASVRRILTCTYCNNDTSDNSNLCTNMADADPPLEIPFNISAACSEARPRIHIQFHVLLRGRGNCDRIEHTPNEAIEFALRFDNRTWIPLAAIHGGGNPNMGLPIGDHTNLVIRGYPVINEVILPTLSDANISLELCDFEKVPNSIQFRWLQTSQVVVNPMTARDFWALDDLRVSFTGESGEEEVLLSDSFDIEQLNSTVWPIEGRRDVHLSAMCTEENQALTFGLNSASSGSFAIFSRSIKTALIGVAGREPIGSSENDNESSDKASTSFLRVVIGGIAAAVCLLLVLVTIFVIMVLITRKRVEISLQANECYSIRTASSSVEHLYSTPTRGGV